MLTYNKVTNCLFLFFLKVFLIPPVVTCVTRTLATAKRSSPCDPTNKEPRRAKIPLGAAAFYRRLIFDRRCISVAFCSHNGGPGSHLPSHVPPGFGSVLVRSGSVWWQRLRLKCMFVEMNDLAPSHTDTFSIPPHFSCICMTQNISYHIFVVQMLIP